MLHAETDGSGPRLVLVHGFTQTRACWGPAGYDLAADHQVVRVDAPGHGQSAEVGDDLWSQAAQVGSVGGGADYLGYSMGGRLVLHLALARPDLVRSLVLVSATAGIDDPAERAARRAADEALAADLERDGLDAFLDRWLDQPLFAGLREEDRNREARRENTVNGLAASLRRAGTGSQEPLWDRLGELRLPVLVVAGELDPKFLALAERLVAGIGASASLAVIPGAGHTAHREQPEAFLTVVRSFAPGAPSDPA